ncbi:MAG TPA: response regulator [Polyangiaceae bacterium]|nr:response regulator [Polyangiaceae bacterium]
MVGPVPAREDEAARLTGARGDFVANLGRRLEALRVSLRAVEQAPSDGALRNGLLRRVHALASAARVLGFASVAEALSEAEKRLRRSEFSDVARALDLLPSLLLGMPVSLRPAPLVTADRAATTWPLSVLIFGSHALMEAIQSIPGTHVECERSEDVARAHEQARIFGPDLAIIDADCAGARELVEALAKDLRIAPVPLLVVGEFTNSEAPAAYLAMGAARVLAKPLNAETLQRTVVELRALTAEPRTGRDPLGELSVAALADRIALEVRRGLLEAVAPSARGTSVAFGDGADVMAAVWGAVARVRELVTLRSSGAVRFDPSGPEGALPMATWGDEERRAGERSATAGEARTGDDVSLQGRRIVIADDDPAVVWFMSGLLKALGVEVLEAHDGARALSLTYEVWPDLVVSDVLMPKLDGFSLCHEIKRDVAVRDVPVILLSWKEDLLQRVRELGASADGYLRKETAAATVAERLREVLRPRARVEQRIAAGGDARGRLDGLTPRLILELASAGERDVRVGFRDAVYLYEVQVRRGQLCSATRSSVDGSFERGEFVLAALLGVSAGRFTVEPDSTPCRVDFEGSAAQVLKAPIERARAALSWISAGSLIGVTRVRVATETIQGYLGCTPEPARGLLDKLIAGASPRELIANGAVAPRLLEAVLSDLARRGALLEVDRIDQPAALPPPEEPARETAVFVSLPPPPSLPMPPLVVASLQGARTSLTPSLAPKVDDVTAEDAGWFSLQLESSRPPPPALSEPPAPAAFVKSAPEPEPAATARAELVREVPAPPPASAPPVEQKPQGLPFSTEVTPAVDRRWEKITEGVFSDSGTMRGVGMPEVARSPSLLPAPTGAEPASPLPPPIAPPRPKLPSVEELDALASALTEASPSPEPVAQIAPVEVPATPEEAAAPKEPAEPAPAVELPAAMNSTLVSRVDSRPPHASSSRISPLKTPTPSARVPAPPNPNAGSFIWLVFVAAAAFAVAYFVITYYRMQNAAEVGAPSSVQTPQPASS